MNMASSEDPSPMNELEVGPSCYFFLFCLVTCDVNCMLGPPSFPPHPPPFSFYVSLSYQAESITKEAGVWGIFVSMESPSPCTGQALSSSSINIFLDKDVHLSTK